MAGPRCQEDARCLFDPAPLQPCPGKRTTLRGGRTSRSVCSCVFLSVATAAATPAQSDAQALSRPRGLDPLRTLFRQRFPAFQASYEQRSASPLSHVLPPRSASAETGIRASREYAATVLRGIWLSRLRLRSVPSLLLQELLPLRFMRPEAHPPPRGVPQ